MRPLIFPYGTLRVCPTFRCNQNCGYCGLTHYQENLCATHRYIREEVDPGKWIDNIARVIPTRSHFIVIFGTGEPGLYHGIAEVVNSIQWNTFYYSNCSNLAMPEIRKLIPRPTLSIYCSYHPTQVDRETFCENAKEIIGLGLLVQNFHAVSDPSMKEQLEDDKKWMLERGVELELNHPFLVVRPGQYSFYGRMGEHPMFRRALASQCFGLPEIKVKCKVSQNHIVDLQTMGYPVAPNGNIYVCWRYMLNHSDEGILGNFFDEGFAFNDNYFECRHFGYCNACHCNRNIIHADTGELIDTDMVRFLWL